jgi:hypothetical protein
MRFRQRRRTRAMHAHACSGWGRCNAAPRALASPHMARKSMQSVHSTQGEESDGVQSECRTGALNGVQRMHTVQDGALNGVQRMYTVQDTRSRHCLLLPAAAHTVQAVGHCMNAAQHPCTWVGPMAAPSRAQ